MPVTVLVSEEKQGYVVGLGRWGDLATEVLERGSFEPVPGVLLPLSRDIELSLAFVGTETIADLNSRYRGKSGPTDVLSFEGDEIEGADAHSPGAEVPFSLGDLVICPEVAARNAVEHECSLDDELALLIVHGILHLLGMDHEEEDEARVMESKEQELLDNYFRPKQAVGSEGVGAP